MLFSEISVLKQVSPKSQLYFMQITNLMFMVGKAEIMSSEEEAAYLGIHVFSQEPF